MPWEVWDATSNLTITGRRVVWLSGWAWSLGGGDTHHHDPDWWQDIGQAIANGTAFPGGQTVTPTPTIADMIVVDLETATEADGTTRLTAAHAVAGMQALRAQLPGWEIAGVYGYMGDNGVESLSIEQQITPTVPQLALINDALDDLADFYAECDRIICLPGTNQTAYFDRDLDGYIPACTARVRARFPGKPLIGVASLHNSFDGTIVAGADTERLADAYRDNFDSAVVWGEPSSVGIPEEALKQALLGAAPEDSVPTATITTTGPYQAGGVIGGEYSGFADGPDSAWVFDDDTNLGQLSPVSFDAGVYFGQLPDDLDTGTYTLRLRDFGGGTYTSAGTFEFVVPDTTADWTYSNQSSLTQLLGTVNTAILSNVDGATTVDPDAIQSAGDVADAMMNSRFLGMGYASGSVPLSLADTPTANLLAYVSNLYVAYLLNQKRRAQLMGDDLLRADGEALARKEEADGIMQQIADGTLIIVPNLPIDTTPENGFVFVPRVQEPATVGDENSE